jgi:hypothetical protein
MDAAPLATPGQENRRILQQTHPSPSSVSRDVDSLRSVGRSVNGWTNSLRSNSQAGRVPPRTWIPPSDTVKQVPKNTPDGSYDLTSNNIPPEQNPPLGYLGSTFSSRAKENIIGIPVISSEGRTSEDKKRESYSSVYNKNKTSSRSKRSDGQRSPVQVVVEVLPMDKDPRLIKVPALAAGVVDEEVLPFPPRPPLFSPTATSPFRSPRSSKDAVVEEVPTVTVEPVAKEVPPGAADPVVDEVLPVAVEPAVVEVLPVTVAVLPVVEKVIPVVAEPVVKKPQQSIPFYRDARSPLAPGTPPTPSLPLPPSLAASMRHYSSGLSFPHGSRFNPDARFINLRGGSLESVMDSLARCRPPCIIDLGGFNYEAGNQEVGVIGHFVLREEVTIQNGTLTLPPGAQVTSFFSKGHCFYDRPNSLLLVIEPVLFINSNICGRLWRIWQESVGKKNTVPMFGLGTYIICIHMH